MTDLDRWVGSSDHADFIRRFQDQEDYYAHQQQRPLKEAMRYTQLYFGHTKDRRGPHEMWRPNIKPSTLISAVNTRVANIADLMNQGDPPIQAVGSTTSAYRSEQKIEHLLAHALYQNRWRQQVSNIVRNLTIMGTAPLKIQWRHQTVGSMPDVTELERIEFVEKAIARGEQLSGMRAPDAVTAPELFELWRSTVNMGYPQAKIPQYPVDGRPITIFHGPYLTQPSLFDLRFDPYTSQVADQHWFAERIVKPLSWVMDNSSDKPGEKLFSRKAVEYAVGKGQTTGREFNELQEEYYRLLGLEPLSEVDPTFSESCELYEVYQPSNSEHPHAVILGREGVINWACDKFPFAHGRIPFLLAKGVHFHGSAYGRSDIASVEDIYKEEQEMRNLRLTSLMLKVLPVFAKAQGVSIPDLQRRLFPGGIVDVNGKPSEAIAPLLGNYQVPQDSFNEIMNLKDELAAAMATYPQVMGQTATVGRVPLGESQGRLDQALTRIKESVVQLEESLHDLPLMVIANYLQFGNEEELVYIAGEDIEWRYNRSELARALAINFEFRGATQALTKDARVQEMLAIADNFGKAGWLSPRGAHDLLRRILEFTSIKSAENIVHPQDTQLMQAEWEAQKNMAIAQASGQQPSPQGVPPAPDEISDEEAQAMQQQGAEGVAQGAV